MPKRILITGPFGTVGREAVAHVLRQNAQLQRGSDNPDYVFVTCFDKKSPVTEKVKEQIEEEFGAGTFVTLWGDLLNPENVRRAVEGQDVVVHLAAFIPPPAYRNPKLAKKINVDGTKTLMDAAAASKRPDGTVPRFVLASSYSVFGPQNPTKPLVLLRSDSPINPQCCYADHKRRCEDMMQSYPGQWSILRIGAVALDVTRIDGPGLDETARLLFSVPGDQRRHGVPAADAGRAFANAATHADPQALHRKILLIGGDDSWRTTAGEFNNFFFVANGIGSLSPHVFRANSGKSTEGYYYESWMDTAETQRLLDFQHTSYSVWRERQLTLVPRGRYLATRALSPVIRSYLYSKSPHFWYNLTGRPDPESDVPMAKLEPGAAITED